MDYSWTCYCSLLNFLFVTITADLGQVLTLNAQQDERIRLECTLTSKGDVEEAMWMRIRSPHNPDILTYRDSVVYEPDRFTLEQRRLSSSRNSNGTFIDTYFLTLTILQPTIEDEGRYICSRARSVFAEYDLFIIVSPHFIDDNSFIQKRTVVEGSTLHLSCSASGRPKPSITWFYRTKNEKHIQLSDGRGCHDPVCEIHLGNYTRHDPTIIECVADNGKSTRVSKVFQVDIYYPPKIITNVRALTGSRSIDVFLECSSLANPLPSIIWLDDNEQNIHEQHFYTVKTTNESSFLSFTVFPHSHLKVLYYCRSNNSVGTVEKLINISEFLQFETKPTHRTTSMVTAARVPTTTTLRQLKTVRITRPRLKTSTIITSTVVSSKSSSTSSTSSLVALFILCHAYRKTK